MQAQAEAVERKAAETIEEMATAKAMALSEYQSSAEFRQVCEEQYDEGVWAFLYNVWREHPEWDLAFLGEMAREMVTEFNTPPKTPLDNPLAEFVPSTDQPSYVADQSPRRPASTSHQ